MIWICHRDLGLNESAGVSLMNLIYDAETPKTGVHFYSFSVVVVVSLRLLTQ